MTDFVMLGLADVEPVRDLVQARQNFGPAAGLFANFAQRRLLVGFARFDVTFRQRPNARLSATDEQRVKRSRDDATPGHRPKPRT